MTKTEMREHLRKVLEMRYADTKDARICFADRYLLAKDGTDEKNVQEIVSHAMFVSDLSFDFSYKVASEAVDILAELDDWNDEDAIHSAVDDAVPIWYNVIATIYTSDWGCVDEWRDEIGGATPSDCMKDAQGAWYNEIEKMTRAIKQGATELLAEQYRLEPKVCPSSLDDDGIPMDENETAHKWDETENPVTCAECGTTKDEDNV